MRSAPGHSSWRPSDATAERIARAARPPLTWNRYAPDVEERQGLEEGAAIC
jgi:hypothetical protein